MSKNHPTSTILQLIRTRQVPLPIFFIATAAICLFAILLLYILTPLAYTDAGDGAVILIIFLISYITASLTYWLIPSKINKLFVFIPFIIVLLPSLSIYSVRFHNCKYHYYGFIIENKPENKIIYNKWGRKIYSSTENMAVGKSVNGPVLLELLPKKSISNWQDIRVINSSGEIVRTISVPASFIKFSNSDFLILTEIEYDSSI